VNPADRDEVVVSLTPYREDQSRLRLTPLAIGVYLHLLDNKLNRLGGTLGAGGGATSGRERGSRPTRSAV
jgi:hypothetical protein